MKTMNAVTFSQPGDFSVMHLEHMPVPHCNDDEVLIRVMAAGVNRPDVLQRRGLYPPPKGASPLLGLEVAGEVVACGAGVTQWKDGDLVCALCNGGGYAEYVNVPAGQCLPVPSGLSPLEAASLPETFFTVWSNVVDRGQLKAGESLLVHGGSSGIGITAIQLASALGAKVFTTAGSREKCDACLELGADHAINYREQDFVTEIETLTAGAGVDVILDMVGGDYIEKNIRCAANDGRIINIAYLRGPRAEVNFMPIMLKRLTLTGSTLRPQSLEYKTSIANALKQQVWPLIESGTIKPVIDSQFTLQQAGAAHQRMESSQHIGKIMLTPDPGP